MRPVLRAGLRLTALLLVLGAVGLGWLWREMERAMLQPIALARPALLTIAPGSNLASIASQLEREGYVPHRWLFALSCRLDGQAAQLKAGSYAVRPGTNLRALLADIVHGRTWSFAITFIEGMRFADMKRVLASAPYVQQTLAHTDEASYADELGVSAPSLEGLFFPSTYRYEVNSTDRQILGRAYRRMQDVLETAWQGRADGLPYTSPYEALIMASIIEKETGLAEERPAIAGVFLRRLRLGMKLQTDPTVIYGLGANFDGDLRRADLRRDTPYNSYTRNGLPPTPIAMPGAAAIEAALHPAPGEALYFVARGDGGHHFSTTLREHNAAVRRYQLNP